MTRAEREARTRADMRETFARQKAIHEAASLAGKAARDRNLRARYGNDRAAAALSWAIRRRERKEIA